MRLQVFQYEDLTELRDYFTGRIILYLTSWRKDIFHTRMQYVLYLEHFPSTFTQSSHELCEPRSEKQVFFIQRAEINAKHLTREPWSPCF